MGSRARTVNVSSTGDSNNVVNEMPSYTPPPPMPSSSSSMWFKNAAETYFKVPFFESSHTRL